MVPRYPWPEQFKEVYIAIKVYENIYKYLGLLKVSLCFGVNWLFARNSVEKNPLHNISPLGHHKQKLLLDSLERKRLSELVFMLYVFVSHYITLLGFDSSLST